MWSRHTERLRTDERRALHYIRLVYTILIGSLVILAYPLIAKATTIDEEPLIHTSNTFGVALEYTGVIVSEPTVSASQAPVSVFRSPETASKEAVSVLILETFPDAPIMLQVAIAESRLDPSAKNPKSTATGLFQVLKGTWEDHGCTGERTDPVDNVNCARKIYDRSNLKPWAASKHMWSK